MRMNSPTGKLLLSMIRDADYAHAGEEEAISLAMQMVAKAPEQKILDAGCGRGGTADFIQKHGWGKVTGLDIDEISIEYAHKCYPDIEFIACSIYDASKLINKQFDLIYLFNSFYCFDNQDTALKELRMLIKPGGRMILFDYTDLTDNGEVLRFREDSGTFFKALKPSEIEGFFKLNGWKITEKSDISIKFYEWYSTLVSRITSNEENIRNAAGDEWYAFVFNFYSSMRDSIKNGKLGGMILTAVPV